MVIKAYEDFVNGYECFCTSDDYEYEMHKAVLALLKEDCHNCKLECLLQKYDELKEKYDKLLKEQEAQKFFVDESGKITPLPAVVRCKDCKHGEKANDVYLCGKQRGFGLAHEPNWFCADGERR